MTRMGHTGQQRSVVLLLSFTVWMTGHGLQGSEAWGQGSLATPGAPLPRDEIARLIKDGRYSAAEAEARALLSQVQRDHGPSSLEAAGVLDLLVEALWRDGRGLLPEARDLAERALAIKEKQLGDRHPELAPSLRNLGTVLGESGDTSGARSLFERAIAIQERAFGPQHPGVARGFIDLANLFVNTGDDRSARPLYERAQTIQEKALGADDPLVALTLHNLALLHYRAGDYATAESLFERSLAIKEKALGPGHLDVAWTLNALAVVLKETGDYTRARSLYERALAIRETVLGPDHLQVGWVLNNLGVLLRTAGDYPEAASCFERAVTIEEKSRGPEHPDVAMARHNLAEVYRLTGDYGRAKSQYEQALEIRLKTIGPDKPAAAENLCALASVLAVLGERDRAQSLYRQALETWRKSLGPDHPDSAVGLRGLATLLFAEGDLAGARPLLEQALRIQRRALGPDHPSVAESLSTLGEILARTGDVGKALDSSLLAEEIGRNHLRLTARTLSEREALRYASVRPSGLDTALSLAAVGLGPAQRRRVWDALIRSRALVLDEMASRRHLASHAGDPDIAHLAADLASASRRQANLTIVGPDPEHPQTYRNRVDRARQEKERAERVLAETSPVFERDRARARLGFVEVAAGLPSGSALVAYVLHREQPGAAASYLAFTLRGGESEPALVSLGPADEIDRLVSRLAEEAGRGRVAAGRTAGEAETAVRSAGTALRMRIWDPLVPKLGKTSRVFVVLDGTLHLVSLAALPVGTTEYLVETGPLIHYLSSERDLVISATRSAPGQGLLALGGAAFDEAAPYSGRDREAEDRPSGGVGKPAAQARFRGERPACSDFQSIRFVDLPASAREVDTIASLWKSAEGERANVIRLTGSQASEAAFKGEAAGRRVLHLATHGFFLGPRCRPAQGRERGIGGLAPAEEQKPFPPPAESPLLWTGLALAGANRRQAAGPDEEDGILTAEEITAMDLSGVEWAVLSACDTGAGELTAGEGVMGLRRALEVAGVATVIMSLWPVEDEAALDWMRALYEERLVKGRPTAEAVRAASLSVLRRRREATGTAHPFYWAGFVAAGDWR